MPYKNKEKQRECLRKWRENNPEKTKEHDKKYCKKNVENIRKRKKKYYTNNKNKVSIWNKINYRLRRKKEIVFSKCVYCNSKDNLIKHHEDYSKPFEIIILCKKCHARVHESLINLCPESPRVEKLDEMPDYETTNGVVV